MKKYSLIWILVLLTAQALQANSYVYSNKKLHPSESAAPLTVSTLGDATFYNQERIDALKVEIAENRREIQKLHEEIEDLRKALDRFKTYYFRKM